MDRSHDDCAETQRRPLPGFDDQVPPDRYCDLILTGGITSAVAYPPAIWALARTYRFRSVGGSSSGAGSAALAAAAEYRRRHGSSDGFRLLLERTAEVGHNFEGKTGLEWLFQPGPKKERLFNVLVGAVTQSADKMGRLGWALFRAYFAWPLLVALLLIVGIGLIVAGARLPYGYAIGVASTLVVLGTYLAIGLESLWADVQRVVDEGYGLCSGIETLSGAPRPPLTTWLHELIQEIAGRSQDEAPLSFADLEAAPGSPRATLNTCGDGDDVSIRLQMFTANLTLGRPRIFPLDNDPNDVPAAQPLPDDDGSALYFLASEMLRLFPEAVVRYMVKVSDPYQGLVDLEDPVGRYEHHDWARDPFRRLPGKRLPIVVAARMSVSFPVLFNAVPLWVVHKDVSGNSRLRRCMFADGGFCSNFPIHLFDSAVPDWPTFGISLRDLIPDHDQQPTVEKQLERMKKSIRLPLAHGEQVRDGWHDFDEKARSSERLTSFLSAMLATTKDWGDAVLAQLPGVRDRVVRVGLAPGIGGLNILMTSEQINALGLVGGEAARRLLERFAQPDGVDGLSQGWNEHRWVRFNILRDCLAESLSGLGASAAGGRFAKPLSEHIDKASASEPLAGDASSKLLTAQAVALQGVLAALQEAERALRVATTIDQPYKPNPRPSLRIRPPL